MSRAKDAIRDRGVEDDGGCVLEPCALVWQLEVEVAHNQAIHSAILGCALAV